MRRSISLRLPLILALAACAPAWAATCKYIDADGHVIYSNTASTPPKGAKKEKCFEDPKPAAAAPEAAPTQSPEGRNREFPKVDDKTQKRRDTERRRILEEELATEQKALEEAKQQLAEQESVRTGGERNYQRFLDRVQPFRDKVTAHERNIEAINREIANLR